MKVVAEALRAQGYADIQDESATDSYDYSALKGGIEWKIEVKGTTSANGECFLLTAPELRVHREHGGKTILAIVSDIDLDRTAEGAMANGGSLEMIAP